MMTAKARVSRLEQQIGLGDGLSGPGLYVCARLGHGRQPELETMLDGLFKERGVSRDHPGNIVIRFVTRYDARDGSPDSDQPAPKITYVAERR